MNRLKEILENKGLKQIWLAREMDVSFNTITNWCLNKTQPDLDDCQRIVEILDLDSVDELVNKNNEPHE